VNTQTNNLYSANINTWITVHYRSEPIRGT